MEFFCYNAIMSLIQRLKELKKLWDPYRPLIEVLIYQDSLLHNLAQYQNSFPKLQFAPVLKSNAYGHGLLEVARILEPKKLPFFMADSLFEARSLKSQGIKTPLLILGYVTAQNINSQKLNNISFGILSLDQLRLINRNLIKKTSFHLKIDTGMRRQGLLETDLPEAIRLIKSNDKIVLEGLCSHLAEADAASQFNQKQISLWNRTVKTFRKEFPKIKYFHLTNSAGADLYADADVNTGRLGLGLYGYNLSPRINLNLKPALEMRSLITTLRQLKKGEAIGYNLTFSAKSDILAATVPVGYTEGLDRRLSGVGALLIEQTRCPILGRVSMNMCSVDVTQIKNPHLEQPVTVISKNPRDPNSVENLARLCNTIPYEILVKIPSYLKRTVTN